MAQCTAKSKQSGQQCRMGAIPGGAVCRFHGGAAPQVQRRARERLDALVDPAIEKLGKLLQRDQHPSVQLAAVKDILDRNGFRPAAKIETQMTLAELIVGAKQSTAPKP